MSPIPIFESRFKNDTSFKTLDHYSSNDLLNNSLPEIYNTANSRNRNSDALRGRTTIGADVYTSREPKNNKYGGTCKQV